MICIHHKIVAFSEIGWGWNEPHPRWHLVSTRVTVKILRGLFSLKMTAIPEDLKHLQDFPQYDASFQDHPQFRQRLEQWADRTEKVYDISTLNSVTTT